MTGRRPEIPEILYVEDNPGDVELMTRLIQRFPISTKLHLAKDGAEALNFFFGREEASKSKLPSLILLDLNLPKKGGREVLAELKQHASTRLIPVVILSTSKNPLEVAECYRLGASAYITKPLELSEFEKVVCSLMTFWLETVQLCPEGTVF